MFDWDSTKNANNRKKHSISFDDAKAIFDGPVLSFEDGDEHGEPRRRGFGLVNGVMVLCVVYTDRGTTRRIISARKATKKERGQFDAYIKKAIG